MVVSGFIRALTEYSVDFKFFFFGGGGVREPQGSSDHKCLISSGLGI
jgi:hypothetical protein